MLAIKRLVLILSVFLVACSEIPQRPVLEARPREAWWLRLRLEAVDKEVWGIPVADIDPSWRRASAYTKSALPPAVFVEGDGDEMARNNTAFKRIADFNEDGVPDVALAGIYRADNGDVGTFILILTLAADGDWKKVFLEKHPGDRSFIAFPRQAEELLVAFCMDCDHLGILEWDGKDRTYVWKVEPDDD